MRHQALGGVGQGIALEQGVDVVGAIALFTGLVSAGFLDADESQFSMARKLGITPTRVAARLPRWRTSRSLSNGSRR